MDDFVLLVIVLPLALFLAAVCHSIADGIFALSRHLRDRPLPAIYGRGPLSNPISYLKFIHLPYSRGDGNRELEALCETQLRLHWLAAMALVCLGLAGALF